MRFDNSEWLRPDLDPRIEFHTVYCDETSLSPYELNRLFDIESLNGYISDLCLRDVSHGLVRVILPKLAYCESTLITFYMEFTAPNPFAENVDFDFIDSVWDASATIPSWASRCLDAKAGAGRVLRRSLEMSFPNNPENREDKCFRLTLANGIDVIVCLAFAESKIYLSPIHVDSCVRLSAPVLVDSVSGIVEVFSLKKFGPITVLGVNDGDKPLRFEEFEDNIYVYFPFLPRLPGVFETTISVNYLESEEVKELRYRVNGFGYDSELLPSGTRMTTQCSRKTVELVIGNPKAQRYVALDVYPHAHECDIDIRNSSGSSRRVLLPPNHKFVRFELSQVIIQPNETVRIRANCIYRVSRQTGQVFVPLEFEDITQEEICCDVEPDQSVIGRYTVCRFNQVALTSLGFRSLTRKTQKNSDQPRTRCKMWLNFTFNASHDTIHIN